MNIKALIASSEKMAKNAKPGILKIGGKTYTFVFDQNQWVYLVYEDMQYLLSYNTKSISKAKEWLKDYLNN